jgi:hypothetical protein
MRQRRGERFQGGGAPDSFGGEKLQEGDTALGGGHRLGGRGHAGQQRHGRGKPGLGHGVRQSR